MSADWFLLEVMKEESISLPYFLLAALGLHCCAGFSGCGMQA